MKLVCIIFIPLPGPQQVLENTLWFSASKKILKKSHKQYRLEWLWWLHFYQKGIIYQHAVPPKTAVDGEYYTLVLIFLTELHISGKRHSGKRHDLVRKGTLRKIMLVRIWLIMFSNIFVNAILKSCHIPLTDQISHHAISELFSTL